MICKLCGKEVPDDALYCDGCGNSFSTVRLEPDQPVTEQPDQASTDQLSTDQLMPEQLSAGQTEQPEWPEAYVGIEDMADGTSEVSEPETVILMPQKIHSYMALAVLTTIFFFNWLLGIPAIVFARECELAVEKGQYDIAKRFSERAISFALIGTAINLAIAAFIALVMIVTMEAGSALYLYF